MDVWMEHFAYDTEGFTQHICIQASCQQPIYSSATCLIGMSSQYLSSHQAGGGLARLRAGLAV
eukprot:scaffold138564_cov33-Prasinocladus_malaysianus.AAC.1